MRKLGERKMRAGRSRWGDREGDLLQPCPNTGRPAPTLVHVPEWKLPQQQQQLGPQPLRTCQGVMKVPGDLPQHVPHTRGSLGLNLFGSFSRAGFPWPLIAVGHICSHRTHTPKDGWASGVACLPFQVTVATLCTPDTFSLQPLLLKGRLRTNANDY